MEMIPVESSNIESIGYDGKSKELHVKFKGNPAIYVYKDVPKDKYDRLNQSESVGKFLNTEIKNVHIFDKVKDGSKEEKKED